MILHSDMNNFYASVEILYDPTLRDKPVAVAGDEEARQGIILAKNDIAKRYGIRTGQVLWDARQQCPGLVCVPAHYERYLAFSAQARDIYTSYTDQVESFGLDECWLDVTGSVGLFGEGPAIADDIRGRIKRELGLTVSVGVSFNKVFAKLGSDMKKPDATTVITPENYRDKAWSLPVSDLLYVGPATTRKLNQYGITTIGELAQANPDLLYWLLGKNGIMLHQFANGQDHSGVRRYYAVPPIHCEEFQKIPVRHGLGHPAVKDRALRGVAVGAVVFQFVGQVAAGHEHRPAAQGLHRPGDALAQPVVLQRRESGQADAQDRTVHPRILKEVQREEGTVIQGGVLFSQGSGPDAGVFRLTDDLLL